MSRIKCRIPDLLCGQTFEENGKERGEIKGEICPDEGLKGKVDETAFARGKNSLELEEQSGFGEKGEGTVNDFDGPGEL